MFSSLNYLDKSSQQQKKRPFQGNQFKKGQENNQNSRQNKSQNQKQQFNKSIQNSSQKNSNKIQNPKNQNQQHQQQQSNSIKKEQKFQNKKFKKNKNSQKSIDDLQESLQGSKFRLLNEFLYTNNSKEALNHFDQNSEDFEVYHQGFQKQAQGWPIQPYQVIIKEIERDPKFYQNSKICDLGCGEAQIYQHFRDKNQITDLYNESEQQIENKEIKQQQQKAKFKIQKMYNFDLIPYKSYIEKANSANLPLENDSTDACIFCLSLMGQDYLKFIQEANRVLRVGGRLIISEVVSRMPSREIFEIMLQFMNFKIIKSVPLNPNKGNSQQNSDEFFHLFVAVKTKNTQGDMPSKIIKNLIDENLKDRLLNALKKQKKIQGIGLSSSLKELSIKILGPCLYKRR